MALRQLLLAREAEALRTEQNNLITSRAEIEVRRAAWREREARAEEALSEMTDETPEADRTAFDAECEEIRAEDESITAEETANETRQGEITERLAAIDAELEELNKRAKPPKTAPAPAANNTITTEREGNTAMNVRERIHAAMESEHVRSFMQGVKDIMQGRGVSNANYLVPTEFLPILRENVSRYSALMKYVNVQRLGGEGSQTILGAVPAAVWTEMTGKINELELSASKITIAGHKVAGYIPVPNSYLEDSEENLAALVLDYLGQSIGFALDKAILYGNGTNMPVGIMTRLSASTQPSWWQEGGPAFTALNTTHIGKASAAAVNGTELYREMATVLGKAKAKYGVGGGKFWAMTEATWTKLQIELMTINASGAVVTGAQMQMPIIGGEIVTLDNIVEDNVIVGGYGSQYLLAERAGMELAQSEHARFTDDVTLFRGKARYDGKPVAGEGFAAFSLTTTAAQTTKTFAEDKANSAEAASE